MTTSFVDGPMRSQMTEADQITCILELFPKQTRLIAARVQIKRALKRRSFYFLCEKVKLYANTMQEIGRPEEFIANPVNWFKEERYLESKSDWVAEGGSRYNGSRNAPCESPSPSTHKASLAAQADEIKKLQAEVSRLNKLINAYAMCNPKMVSGKTIAAFMHDLLSAGSMRENEFCGAVWAKFVYTKNLSFQARRKYPDDQNRIVHRFRNVDNEWCVELKERKS